MRLVRAGDTNHLQRVTAMAMLWSLMKVLCLNLVAVLAILMYEFYHIREGFIRQVGIQWCTYW